MVGVSLKLFGDLVKLNVNTYLILRVLESKRIFEIYG